VGVTKVKKTWPLVLLAAWLVFNSQADPENKDLRHRFVSHRIVLKHPGINENKPRTYSLSQTLDERGHPVGYSMEVDSVICTVGLCKVVKVMMKWDAVGFYRGYSVADGSILEKALIGDAKASPEKKPWGGQLIGGNAVRNKKAWTAFNDADHAKLHRILRDRSSVLRSQRISDLTGYRDKSRVDGVSGATPLTLKKAVVSGAALSSYHLWHWANGEVVSVARELTHKSCSEGLLRSFLVRDEPHYVLFALEHLRLHQCFDPSLVSVVVEATSAGNQEHIDLGIAYLKAALPDQDAFHAELALLFTELDMEGRVYLLGVLDAESTITGSLLDKFSQGLKNVNTYYELHRFLSLVEKQQQVSEIILTRVSRFLEDENFFIARRAFLFLGKQSLNEPMAKQVAAFEAKCERKNRMLR